nr:unnamed protein product [Callosobruchus analis]
MNDQILGLLDRDYITYLCDDSVETEDDEFYQLEDVAAEIDLWFHLRKGKQMSDYKLNEKDIEIIDLLNGTDAFYPTISKT